LKENEISLIVKEDAGRISRYQRRKEEIVIAAGAVINKIGLRDTTLAVVASEIGLNLKSLRHYFARREDLVAAAFLRSIALHRDLATRALAAGDPERRVRFLIQGYFNLRVRVVRGEEPPFVHFGDLRALSSPHREAVLTEYIQLFRSVRSLLLSPSNSSERARLNAHAYMLISQLLWSVVWLPNYLPEDYEDAGDRLTDLLWNGIVAKPSPLPLTVASAAPVSAPARLNQEAFLVAATQLINTLGYVGASVDRISALLNVTKGSFYHHNDNRDGLVVACFDRTFDVIRKSQNAALDAEHDGLARILFASADLVGRQTTPDGVLLRTSALTCIGPEIRQEMSRQMSIYTGRFADMLNRGLNAGSVRPCDLRIAAEIVTAMINSAAEIDQWVPGFDPARANELALGPVFHGLKSL
jgi:AcrR family transcriptional regulator